MLLSSGMTVMALSWYLVCKMTTRVRRYVVLALYLYSSNLMSLVEWHITLLTNKNYTIKNCSYSSFANKCTFRPVKGDMIAGKARKQQWIIRESKYQGQYMCVIQCLMPCLITYTLSQYITP
jgi:hypothetical protein